MGTILRYVSAGVKKLWSRKAVSAAFMNLSRSNTCTSVLDTITNFVILNAVAGAGVLAVSSLKPITEVVHAASIENIKCDDDIESNTLVAKAQPKKRFNFIGEIVKKCAPAVVNIEIKDPRRYDVDTGGPMTASNGSGFIIGEDGWILTNAHVVLNKPYNVVTVILHDGSTYQATVEDVDAQSDLALLRIPCRNLPKINLGSSSDVTSGEWVVALGSPLSLSHTATAGIVSSTERSAAELGLNNHSMKYIQTDAAITFGNSGGPLVNMDGDVIGINNLRVTAGISFAIPIDYAKNFLSRTKFANYRSRNTPAKQTLGFTTLQVNEQVIRQLIEMNNPVPKDVKNGVYVWKVISGTPAHRYGLKEGDIITHVNGVPIIRPQDIYVILKSAQMNDPYLKLDVVRYGRKQVIELAIKNVN